MQEFQHLVKVIQRLANAHQHDMGDALPDIPLRCIDLGADLSRLQVAHPARLGGCTEAAAHPAAHLGGYADRIAIVVAHDHRFDAVAVRHTQEILDRTILGLLAALDLGAAI